MPCIVRAPGRVSAGTTCHEIASTLDQIPHQLIQMWMYGHNALFPIPDVDRTRFMLIIGGKDMEAGAVSVRLHHGGPQGAKPNAEVIADILASINERKA